jgi:selenocysteine-specific elongation factor
VAESGQRTAVNLQGIEKAAIERGNVLTRPGTFEPTRRLDVFFDYLQANDRKMKNRTLVRFHAGASEVMARLSLLDRDEIEPGGKAYAQLFLAAPAVAMAGDHFVIRSYSPVTTVGGGQVIDPLSRKHRRHSDRVIRELDRLHHGAETEKLAAIIQRASFGGIDPQGLVIRTGLPPAQVRKGLDLLFSRRQAVLLDREETRALAPEVYGELQRKMLEDIRAHHEKFPLKEGLSREELRMKLGAFIGQKLFHAVMRDLEKNGKIVTDRENIRLPDHRVSLQADQESLRRDIADWYQKAALSPPSLREVTEKFTRQKSQVGSILNVMLKDGTLTKINEDLCFDGSALKRLREDYKSLLLKDGKATPATFKELTGLSRKYIIPLMEYFDVTKLTVRSGDHRLLREKGN